jgi:excisionase family DNA binding protein
MPDVLTAPEAAEYLRTSVDAVKRLARQGRIPGAKIGRGWRFRKSDLDELFVENVLDRLLGREAKAVLADPDTEWVSLAQVRQELGL